jgi:hypothetical protein
MLGHRRKKGKQCQRLQVGVLITVPYLDFIYGPPAVRL